MIYKFKYYYPNYSYTHTVYDLCFGFDLFRFKKKYIKLFNFVKILFLRVSLMRYYAVAGGQVFKVDESTDAIRNSFFFELESSSIHVVFFLFQKQK